MKPVPVTCIRQPKLSFKKMTQKSGIIRSLRKKAQILCPHRVIFIQPPQHVPSLLIWWPMFLFGFVVLLFIIFLFIPCLSSLSEASSSWVLNDPLCLLWIKSRALLLNLISHVICLCVFLKETLYVWNEPKWCIKGISLPEKKLSTCETVDFWLKVGAGVGAFTAVLLVALTCYFWKKNRK